MKRTLGRLPNAIIALAALGCMIIAMMSLFPHRAMAASDNAPYELYRSVLQRAANMEGEYAVYDDGYTLPEYYTRYTLFDIDRDGTAELLVKAGKSEVSKLWRVYALEGDAVSSRGFLGEFECYLALFSVGSQLYGSNWHANGGEVKHVIYRDGAYGTEIVLDLVYDRSIMRKRLAEIGVTILPGEDASDTSLLDNYAAMRRLDSMDLWFPDVDYGSNWVAREGWLNAVSESGLMAGYKSDDGIGTAEFGPNDPITRGQVATILFRYANPGSTATTDASSYAVNATRFRDNASGQYYTAAMNWALEQGIFTGDANTGYTTVRPDDGITRQELATVLYRFATGRGASTAGASAATYAAAPDARSVQGWASEGMGWCYKNSVMTGDSTTGRLNPAGGATRAHMAKMITVVTRDVL